MIDVWTAMSAAGHPDRARILDAIRESVGTQSHGLSISEIAARCDIDRFSASRHLTLLRSAGLVTDIRVGYRRVHHLRIEAFEAIEDWVVRFTCGLDADTSVVAQLI